MSVLASSGIDVSTALTTLSTVFTSALGLITDNAVLMIFFASGLLGVGFGLIRSAKKAARR